MKWGKFNQRFKGLVNGIGAMLGFLVLPEYPNQSQDMVLLWYQQ